MKKTLAAVVTIGFIAFATMAFAGMHGKGNGGHHEMSNNGQGQCWNTENLSKKDQAAMEAECNRFSGETQEIRRSIYQKKLALRSELAKSEIDIAVAKKLQKEISGLKSDMGEKKLDHIITMKKINPDAGMGYMGKGHGGKSKKGGCPRQ